MKTKNLFFPFLAALAFAGCSNDDFVNEGEGNEGKGEIGYVAVNIVQPKSVGTRAASTGFEYGKDDENYAKEGLFFIFDKDGNVVGKPQTLSLKGAGTGTSPEVEHIYDAVLVVNRATTKPTEEKQIVCVLNAPAGLETVSTLSGLKDKVGDYRAAERGQFIMTNSVYKKDGNEVLGADITDANIAQSPTEALTNPVNVYVERIVAKIKAKEGEDFDNAGAVVKLDGADTNLDIKITGIEIANIANQSYLFKNVTGFASVIEEWAWDPTNKRSYWETVPTGVRYENQSYNQIVEGFGNLVIDDTYIQPNTSKQKTAVLVTAELQDPEYGTGLDMVYLGGGYTTPNKALNTIAYYTAKEGFWKKVADNEYEQLSSSDFEWNDNVKIDGCYVMKSYEVAAQVKSTIKELYKKVDGEYTEATAEDVNKVLLGTDKIHPYVARYYKEGKCYYFVNIDQSSIAGAKAHTYDGVVRNHIYKLTLNSIQGIGTPVFDPNRVIIPEKPVDEELYYISAQLKVLAWKVVSQNVDFGKE